MSSAADVHPGPFTLADGLRVGLSPEEPAGMICTRNAGALELEASLQWPPEVNAVPVFTASSYSGDYVRADLEETVTDGCNSIRGRLSSPYEDGLRAALDEVLRDLARAATLREAALTARTLRSRSPLCAGSAAVEPLARLLWEAGLEVRFGVSWLPAPEGSDVTVGCQGAEERIMEALAGRGEAPVALPVEVRGEAG